MQALKSETKYSSSIQQPRGSEEEHIEDNPWSKFPQPRCTLWASDNGESRLQKRSYLSIPSRFDAQLQVENSTPGERQRCGNKPGKTRQQTRGGLWRDYRLWRCTVYHSSVFAHSSRPDRLRGASFWESPSEVVPRCSVFRCSNCPNSCGRALMSFLEMSNVCNLVNLLRSKSFYRFSSNVQSQS